jgi:hypothetical protein
MPRNRSLAWSLGTLALLTASMGTLACGRKADDKTSAGHALEPVNAVGSEAPAASELFPILGGNPTPPPPMFRRRGQPKPAASAATEPSADPSAEPSAAASGSAPAPSGSAMSPDADPVVTLVSDGGAPKVAVRWKSVKGAKQHVDLLVGGSMQMKLEGQPQRPSLTPTIRTPMLAEVLEARPNGDRKIEIRVERPTMDDAPGADPKMLEAIRKALGDANGLRGSTVLTDRGFSHEVALAEVPPSNRVMLQVASGLRQTLTQLSPPLPAEPIGVGAKWKVKRAVEQNGVPAVEEDSYELIARMGDQLRIKLVMTQTATPQEVHAANVPPGTKVRLDALESSGNGEILLDLGKPMPIRQEMKMSSRSLMSVSGGGQRNQMEMVSIVESSLAESKPGAPPSP